ncbi:MAG: YbaB/EbfC family nucleoid-associated protein [Candidatus Omnitrophica bacterium]|nr:YbaB/EbfC family nucleoid-associated protein [Candidatus Omnitrophota bacterium]
MLDKLKQMVELQKKALSAKKALSGTHISAESKDGLVKIEITGEMKIQSIDVDPRLLGLEQKNKLETSLKDGIQNAISQAQKEAMGKISGMAGGLDLGSLFKQ